MDPEHIERLLSADESETLERKQSLSLRDEIRDSIIAFANDMYGRGPSWIIVGQSPNKEIVGLTVSDDEAQRIISDIARQRCTPAIPVSVECYQKEGRRLAIIEVRRSPARPHFAGKALVRMGSTTRQATDAEIILLRAIEENRKIALLKRWFDEGKTAVMLWQMARPGEDLARSPGAQQMRLLDVSADWIVVDHNGAKRSFAYDEFHVVWDEQNNMPQIRYHGGR